MPMVYLLVVCTLAGRSIGVNADDEAYYIRLEYTESLSSVFSDEISDMFGSFQDTAQGDESCVGYDMMADELKNYKCEADFGDTAGCECSGRAVGEFLPVMVNLYWA